MSELTHFDSSGSARMVDVGDKPVTARLARAEATIEMQPATAEIIRSGGASKGDVLAVARLAGIMASKKTSDLIPLCHALGLDSCTVEFEWSSPAKLRIEATVRNQGRTGVEMEALVAASVSSLTVYDMCKAIDRGMTVTGLRLIEKQGGKSGHFRRETESAR